MNWTERLNRSSGRVPVGQSRAQIFHWDYCAHLPDNRPHRHTYFEVCRVGDYGSGEFIVEDKVHALRPGDVFIARPGVVHQIVNTATPLMELFWVAYSWPHCENGKTAVSLKTAVPPKDDESAAVLRAFAASPIVVVPDAERCIATLWWALQVVASAEPRVGQDLQLQALTASLLLAIAQAAVNADMLSGTVLPQTVLESADDAGASLARMAVRYVHDNLDRPLSIPEVAAQVHVSPRHLLRIWRQFTGVTPAAYIERARLDRAAVLLGQSGTAIKEIAQGVGYGDVHHFSRVFRRCFGCPPGEYRRRYQAGESVPVAPDGADVRNIQKPGALV